MVGVKTVFMVKADAYGHGLCEVATAVEDVVDGFGVAVCEEGMALRSSGINKPILLLLCRVDELVTAVKNRLSICLNDISQLIALENAVSCDIINRDEIKIHIAVDTGMHRLGFCVGDLNGVLLRLYQLGVNVEGVYSHLRVRSSKQKKLFDMACHLVHTYYPNAIRHISSSHSANCKSLRYDAVRVGLSAYENAMRVESEVVTARMVSAGEYVSYGNYKLKHNTNTAVVFGGYADGVARERPSCVYIRGRECKVIGNVCMDMCIVDCGDFLPDIGERVILTDGDKINTVVKMRHSIEYTLMTCWKGRIERIYEYDKGRSKKTVKAGSRTTFR